MRFGRDGSIGKIPKVFIGQTADSLGRGHSLGKAWRVSAMSARRRKVIGNARPVAAGTGLVALDVVYSGDTAEPLGRWAGGTCGNVLTILSCLGWSSYPVARLADNAPAR